MIPTEERPVGGAREKDGRFYANARFGRGDRVEVATPWSRSLDDTRARAQLIAEIAHELVEVGRRDLVRETARQLAVAATEKRLEKLRNAARKLIDGAVRAGAAHDITIREWGRRYTSGELARDFPDHVRAKDYADDESRLKNYVYKHVGDIPVALFRLEHAELVMRKLPPKKIRRAASRRHVAQVLSRLLTLAVYPGKLIPASPIPRGWLPKLKARRHYSCLFPREEAKFLAHEPTPLVFRIFCGILDREGMRISELWSCEKWQWNLDEGTFTTTKTKTEDPRMWAVRPDVADVMRRWCEGLESDARPFAALDELVDPRDLAEYYRTQLKAAGITRPELFATTEHTGQLRAHDMRATFVTISMSEGRSETWIRDRTAHKSTSMIDRYRRTARQFTELKLGSLVPLGPALGGWWKRGGSAPEGGASASGKSGEMSGGTEGGTRTLTTNGRRILNAATPIDGPTIERENPVENDVAIRRDPSLHRSSTTPSATSRDASGGPTSEEVSRDRDVKPDKPLEGRVRVEIDGAVVAEASGSARKVARGIARGLRRAGLPAIADKKIVRVGGGS